MDDSLHQLGQRASQNALINFHHGSPRLEVESDGHAGPMILFGCSFVNHPGDSKSLSPATCHWTRDKSSGVGPDWLATAGCRPITCPLYSGGNYSTCEPGSGHYVPGDIYVQCRYQEKSAYADGILQGSMPTNPSQPSSMTCSSILQDKTSKQHPANRQFA